jgi:hypothetical protein
MSKAICDVGLKDQMFFEAVNTRQQFGLRVQQNVLAEIQLVFCYTLVNLQLTQKSILVVDPGFLMTIVPNLLSYLNDISCVITVVIISYLCLNNQ